MTNEKLDSEVRYIKGVGPKVAKLLSSLGIETIGDLLYSPPRNYEDRRNIKPIANLKEGEEVLIKGKITKVQGGKTRKMLSIIKILITDGTGSIYTTFFNQPFLLNIFKKGSIILLAGKVDSSYTGKLEILVRDYELVDREIELGIVPKYSLTEGLYQKKMRNIVREALSNYLPALEDFLPESIRSTYKLLSLKSAIYNLHFPPDIKDIKPARERLVFDEFFIFQLGLALRKKEMGYKPGIAFKVNDIQFENSLPFKLTSAQIRVIEEIKTDMEKGVPMNRLLQGDVGSGKTVVAVIASLIAVQSGYQVALMAPTEILAQQHYFKISEMLKEFNIRLKLLTSNEKDKEISSADIVIGTHALIEEKIKFKKLGLVIIDEQHRFGVIQRASLKQKGYNPDLLVMTATPIPRTLALTLYGDLDRSIIDEMPKGRVPIKTFFVPEEKRKDAYEFIRSQINEGRQVYVVCPLLEESEGLDFKAVKEEARRLKEEVFPEFEVELIHGKLKAEEKERIMRKFKEGLIQILVSTTVIEVGIDISNATVMVIEHAERFGLSQLHQLRGRIGRGANESYCLLLGNLKTEESKKRIAAMLKSNNGFYIAEVDLTLRGPGEFYGLRQSGLPNFRVADIITDEDLLKKARDSAFSLVKDDPKLEGCPSLKDLLISKYGRFFKLGALD